MNERPTDQMRNIAPFGLRMQPDLKARVQEAADANGRSMNSEIVARLEASFAATADTSPAITVQLFDSFITDKLNEALAKALDEREKKRGRESGD